MTGRVVIMKDLGHPDESEHVFMFAWVRSVNDHRLQVIEYSQSTDLYPVVNLLMTRFRCGLIV